MPNSTRPFKLNWASGGGLAERRFVSLAPMVSVLADPLLVVMTAVLNTQSSLVISALKSTYSSLFLSSRAAFRPANPPRL